MTTIVTTNTVAPTTKSLARREVVIRRVGKWARACALPNCTAGEPDERPEGVEDENHDGRDHDRTRGAASDTLRLLVLRVLRKDSFGVSELCAIFDTRQPALSHHLKVLANAGLVAARREANTSFYRRSELGQHPDLEALQREVGRTLLAFEAEAKRISAARRAAAPKLAISLAFMSLSSTPWAASFSRTRTA